MPPLIIIFTGPSASGKTTLVEYVMKELDFVKPITYTTRKPRSEETYSSYCFVTKEEFLSKIDRNEMAEYVTNFGYYYGSEKKSFESDKNIVVALDYRGAKSIKQLYPNRCIVIGLTVSKQVMLERINKRSAISEDQIQKRLEEYDSQFRHKFDYLLENNGGQDQIQKRVMSIISGLIEEKKINTSNYIMLYS